MFCARLCYRKEIQELKSIRFKIQINITIGGNDTVLYKMNCPINNKEGQRRERELILATFLGTKVQMLQSNGERQGIFWELGSTHGG